jgi:hypothetical protein
MGTIEQMKAVRQSQRTVSQTKNVNDLSAYRFDKE